MSDRSGRVDSSTFTGLLGLTFIVLKLTGVIAWSWWWVLAPFWVPIALFVVFLGILGIIWFVTRWT